MGCRFGAELQRAGMDVCLYDVARAHVDKIQRDGLKIHSERGEETMHIRASCDPSSLPRPDIAAVFTKTMYTESALSAVSACFGEKTVVLTLQNGLGNIRRISAFVPQERIIAGVTTHACDLIGPGEIFHCPGGLTKVMPLGETAAPCARRLAQALNEWGTATEITDKVICDIWEKVAFNAAFNTTSAVTMLTVGQLGASEYGRELLLSIAKEVTEIANASGIPADFDRVRGMILTAVSPDGNGDHKPSMLQDRLAGRPTEIEAICGEAIRIAKEHGLTCPNLLMAYRQMKMIEAVRQ